MRLTPLVALLALGLTGCDAVQSSLEAEAQKSGGLVAPQTIVIRPGAKMSVSGQTAAVFGAQPCPYRQGFDSFVLEQDPDEGLMGCVIITPDTEEVTVRVSLPDGLSRETWLVERAHDETRLRRADGSYLAAAR